MLKSTLLALVAAVLVPWTLGCGEGMEPTLTGDLQVTYRVGSGSSTCADVGIASLRVHIFVNGTEVVRDEIFACEPGAQSVTFADIQEGTFTVRIEGLDSGSRLIFAGEAFQPFTVVAGQTNGPINVVLDQLRPALEIFFGFVDVGSCEQNGVRDLKVRVFENGSAIILDQSYLCTMQIDQSVLIEGLSDTSTFDLRVRGINEYGEGAFEYNEDGIVVTAGAATEVSADLTACVGVCTVP
jgi:hypothetical protein